MVDVETIEFPAKADGLSKVRVDKKRGKKEREGIKANARLANIIRGQFARQVESRKSSEILALKRVLLNLSPFPSHRIFLFSRRKAWT